MLAEMPYGLPGKIYGSPMPFSQFAGIGLWEAYQRAGISLIVVLAEKQECLVYAGKDLPAYYRSQGMDALHLPVPDYGIPEHFEDWESGIQEVVQAARDGRNCAVHCLAGKGRTGLFLACLAKKVKSLDGSQAIQWVRNYLPGAVESPNQESWAIET